MIYLITLHDLSSQFKPAVIGLVNIICKTCREFYELSHHFVCRYTVRSVLIILIIKLTKMMFSKAKFYGIK